MMYMSPKTKDRFALDYDANGDCYTKDLDVESLKQIFERIDEKVKQCSSNASPFRALGNM
jgi:hypothetical protein